MSREKFGSPKQSSTMSARAVYELLVEEGYTPRLINPDKPLISNNWGAVIVDRNVAHSKSGDSIQMVDASGQNRVMITLKTKGMMSVSSLSYFRNFASVPIKPSP